MVPETRHHSGFDLAGLDAHRMGGPKATNSAEESVEGVRKVIAGLTMADTGKFFNFNGQVLSW